ncbi:MAG: hypothetical protein DRI01_04600 [Chloroflexi bacterium]|nr:MAG: hypothetical protein DRI01_04600 [Chloroflexota bacterium]
MKSKKLLISLGLAVVLAVAFALPACNGEGEKASGWYTPEGERIEFEISAIGGKWGDMALMVTSNLQDLGLDVKHRIIDSTTYYEYLYEPNLGGMQAFISGEDPSPDPWSDWIWMMLSDPESSGYLWNPCWYDNEHYTELMMDNFLASNLSAKKEILFEMQEILAEDLPVIFLTRDDFIAAHRTDTWDNWFNELGGYVSWINEWSIREVTPLTDDKQLNIGTLSLPTNLLMNESALTYTGVGCLYLMLVYENLCFFPKVDEASMEANPNAAYEWVPKLAKTYSISYEYDGKGRYNQVWTINLQEGVKWHDYDTSGEYLDADDVVYTVKYAMTRWGNNRPVDWDWVYNTTNPNCGDITPDDMLVEKTGPLQVTFTYIEGYHQNEGFFPSCFLWKPIVPKHKFEGKDPYEETGDYIGTGPYILEEFVPDEYMLLERNDDYWGPLPEAEKVLFKLYPDLGSMLLALEAGEIDTITHEGVPQEKVVDYMANPNIEVEVVPGLSVNYLGFNLHPTEGYEPLQDLALREAIAAAIDKQGIVDLVHRGYGEIADSWTYNESPNHHPSLPNTEYDPTKARQILLDAGYTYVE